MRAERDGDTKYVSDKGAIGLMQLMPAAYQELHVEHGLGTDSFDPRDNILAGAAYLSEMLCRYGSGGFLAADNAGRDAMRGVYAAVRCRPRPSIMWLAWRQNSAPRGSRMRQRPRRLTR